MNEQRSPDGLCCAGAWGYEENQEARGNAQLLSLNGCGTCPTADEDDCDMQGRWGQVWDAWDPVK